MLYVALNCQTFTCIENRSCIFWLYTGSYLGMEGIS